MEGAFDMLLHLWILTPYQSEIHTMTRSFHGRGRTVVLLRQERRENMIYMDVNNPDIYDLIDRINSWFARQRAMGATLPEETIVKQIFPEIMSKAASATTWLVGTRGSNGFLGGKSPEDSMLGKII
eukprot:9498233-Pyramimonas_sp.AAC.1